MTLCTVKIHSAKKETLHRSTVEPGYLKLGYLRTRSVYLNQKYNLIAFSIHNLAFGTFLQVQITRNAN